MEDLINLDDYLKYFTDMGFKLVKDEKNGEIRSLTLRSYTMDQFSEVFIKQNGSDINVRQTLNGKPV